MKKILLSLAIVAFAFTSCKKKDKAKECPISEANLIGSYVITSVKYKVSSSATEIDYSSQFFDEPCQKDDVLTFNSNHTYTNTDAGTKCSPTEDFDGDWSLNSNVLSLDGDPGTIENFNCSAFTVYANDVNTSGDKISVTYTKK